MGDIMDEYMKVNQDRWNELVAIHARSKFYDVESFKAGTKGLNYLEREEVGDVAGKSLLHLQCHFGMDTLAWARLGAKVTGVDYSEKAIEQARSLSSELGIEANFVCSNIYDLPENLSGQFDIVYTSYGVLGWLPDLEAWGKIIAHFLKPGGFFYIAEGHPFIWIFDEGEGFKVKYPYFTREALKFEVHNSYADQHAQTVNTTEYGWNHTLSEIFGSLLSAGLKIDFFHEHTFCAWECFPNMVEGEDGFYRLKENDGMIPLMFSLKATKEVK
jgi:SAM-dependent methyltransferase